KKIEQNILRIFSEPDDLMDGWDPEWRTGIAAIYYGAPRDKALQLALEGPLSSAMRELDLEAFKRLLQAPGADRVVEKIVEAAFSTNDLTFFSHTAFLLKGAELGNTARMHAILRKIRSLFTQEAPVW